MELLLVPIPLFNKHSAVEAYLFRYRLSGPPDPFSEPSDSPLLKALNVGGIDAFTGGKPLFVPISSVMLLGELERQCQQPPGQVVFLLEDSVPIQGIYLSNMSYLRQMGYRFALSTQPHNDEPDTLLGISDYVLLGQHIMEHSDRKAKILAYKRANRHLEIIATGLDTLDSFDKAVEDKADLFEGQFYYMPLTKGEQKITPLKANLIHLLNLVRDENFEFDHIASIVQRDPALSVQLMRFINSPYLGIRHKIKTIRHAVTILGTEEMRKWVTAAVFKSLGTDRPGELVRLSLVRAKFAENLAPCFGMTEQSQALFLTGLFSVLDVVLDTTMDKALETVSVSDEITAALLDNAGPYYKVIQLLMDYERADWDNVQLHLSTNSLTPQDTYSAYIDAVSWYHDLISERVRPTKG